MNFSLERPPAPVLPLATLLVLTGVYLLVGVIGHGPWKGEDALHLGIAYSFWQEGHWLLPSIAGEPWPHTAPLYHWTAAGLGALLYPLIPFHDGARLATPLFASLFLVAIGHTAQQLYGRQAGRIAPLLAIGTLGLMAAFHDAQPAVAGLAFAACAWWGAARLLHRQRYGLWLLGGGSGLAVAAHGLVGLLMVLAVLPTPTFLDLSRTRRTRMLLALVALALPLALAWPLAVQISQPDYIAAWWHNEWAETTVGRQWPRLRHLEFFVWAAWPAWPLALWGAWLLRQRAKPSGSTLTLLLPLAGLLIGLTWFCSGPPRTLGLFPALIPCILLAAAGAEQLRRGATNAFDWFAAITFSGVAALVWLGASALFLDWPATIARNFDKLAPGYTDGPNPLAGVIALAASLAWVFAWRLPRAPWRSSLRWATGTAMTWCLVASLWIGWIDHYKSYRPLVGALRAALGESSACIERINISISQRALLDYYGNLRTTTTACPWRLRIDPPDYTSPAGWTRHWQGARPSDRKERWTLERRTPLTP